MRKKKIPNEEIFIRDSKLLSNDLVLITLSTNSYYLNMKTSHGKNKNKKVPWQPVMRAKD